jgi:serine/threonine protein phosphatase 1
MIYAIGDIHGRLPQLKDLYNKILIDIRMQKDEQNTIVFLGDYIDRGKYSMGVLDFLSNLQNSADKLVHVFVVGNHEVMFCDAVTLDYTRTPPNINDWAIKMWVNNGGETVIKESGLKNFNEFFLSNIHQKYTDWIKNKTYMLYETTDYVFVHGGLDIRQPPDKQNPDVVLWSRFDKKEHYDDYPKMVVHGHTPVRQPVLDKNRINVDTSFFDGGKTLTAVALENRLGARNSIRFLQSVKE